MLLELMARSGRSLAELAASAMTRLPQVMVSVTVPDPRRLETASAVWDEVAQVQAALGEGGRVVLRASGTEPKVRVMAEAESHDAAEVVVGRLVAVVRRELGEQQDAAPR